MDNTEEHAYLIQRLDMVERQIASRDVKDLRVLSAMRTVPRHLFLPPAKRVYAYEDHPLPIGEAQTISQPYIVAAMTEALQVSSHAKILEIGTGSGYQTAVLAELTDHVYTIEYFESLAVSARECLQSLGYTTIQFKQGDGNAGWAAEAPFDGIIVTCAPRGIPPKLTEQLAEGGRLVIPIEEQGHQELVVITKEQGQLHRKDIFAVVFVPMLGK